MLTIRVGSDQGFDEATQEFVETGGTELVLEHSLLSLSKWESKYEKPFFNKDGMEPEEFLEYIKLMTLTPDVPPEVFLQLHEGNVKQIVQYMESKSTATWFSEREKGSSSREVVTSELIYYWMTQFQIPIDCERWNINRLFTLIRVCNVKQSKPKKISRAEAARQQRELNAKRRAELGSTG